MGIESTSSKANFLSRLTGFFRRSVFFGKGKKEHKSRHVQDLAILLQKGTIKELGIYSVFMLTLNIIILGSSSVNRYYLTTVFTELLVEREFGNGVTFTRIATVEDIWQYLEVIALPFIYYRYAYESNKHENMRQVVYENLLLGYPRLRHIRVRNGSCDVPSEFTEIITSCYSPYSKGAEETSPFGAGNSSAWTYHTDEELAGFSYSGQVATYGGGGSYEDLGLTYEVASQKIATLKQLNWIRRGSRFVVLDFSTYNLNVNLITFVKLVFELPATGGVVPSYNIKCMTFLRYINSHDTFILFCEIIFCLFTTYYLVEEVIEIKADFMSYAKNLWNYVDTVILVISIFCILFSAYCSLLIRTVVNNLFSETNKFFNFENLAYWNLVYTLLAAILCFLCWLKVFKYISFNLTMVQLATTLSRCAKDIAGFGIMFFIIFFAYAELGFLLFGNQLEDYMLLHYSMQEFKSEIEIVRDLFYMFLQLLRYTLLRTILGDFDFKSLEQADRWVGPIFFITYVFFVFFVLLNMFLAIINDTYMEVKSELKAKHSPVNVLSSALKAYAIIAKKCLVFRRNTAEHGTPQKTEISKNNSVPHIDVIAPSTPSPPSTPPSDSNKEKDKLDTDESAIRKSPSLLKTKHKLDDALKNVFAKKSLADEVVASISRREFDDLVRVVDDLMEDLERIQGNILPQLSRMTIQMETFTSRKKSNYRIEH